ncbi:MAG: hypothetical protein ACRDL7_09415, partial [Gaiellaceae bacterium]
LERRYATRIQVVLNATLMPHQSEFEAKTRVEAGQPEVPQIRLGGVTATEPAPQPAATSDDEAAPATSAPAAASAASADGAASGKRRRRRRGRRRGRGRQAAAAIGEALTALAAGTSLAQSSEEAAETVPQDAGAEHVSQRMPEEIAHAVEDTPHTELEASPAAGPEADAGGARVDKKPGSRTRGTRRRGAGKAGASSRGRKKAVTVTAAVPADAVAKPKRSKPAATRKTTRPRRPRGKSAPRAEAHRVAAEPDVV